MVQSNANFRGWLKSGSNMKLSSDAAVLRLIHEGVNNFAALADFDTASIQLLPKICREAIPAIAADEANNIAAEPAIAGANINSVSVQRLIVASHAVRYYRDVDRIPDVDNMNYQNVLVSFKLEYDAYEKLKKEDAPTIPKINDRLGDRKIIHWAPIFRDTLSSTVGVGGPLSYVLREDSTVPAAATDTLAANAYYGKSGSLRDEIIARAKHEGPLYKADNSSVFLKIEEAVRGTSVESSIKAFSRTKNGRGAFRALVSNHAGETKYRAIAKKRMNHLTQVKWTGNAFPLETHVSHQRTSADDLRDCANHITVPVPNASQRVEYLIDSITCKDAALQAVIGLIRSNNNNMRNDFEAAATAMIEVDPYKRSSKNVSNRNANVSALDFNAGRGVTGVDLRFHPKREYENLPENKAAELREWLQTTDGKKHKREYFAAKKKEKPTSSPGGSAKRKTDANAGNWKKKMRRAMKTNKGIKSVMSILAEEEQSNKAFVAALEAEDDNSSVEDSTPSQPSTPKSKKKKSSVTLSSLTATKLPATTVRLTSILKKR